MRAQSIRLPSVPVHVLVHVPVHVLVHMLVHVPVHVRECAGARASWIAQCLRLQKYSGCKNLFIIIKYEY